MVQWLRLQASIGEGTGSIPDEGTKTPHVPGHGQEKKQIFFFFLKSISLDNKFSSLIFDPHRVVTLEQTSSLPAHRTYYV